MEIKGGKKMNTLQNNVNTLKEVYKGLVIQEINLAETISNLEKDMNYDTSAGIRGQSNTEITTDYVKITINRLPEAVNIIKSKDTYYSKTKKFWQLTLANALNNKALPNLKQAVVLINICYKNKTWDIDNYTVKFIIDSIKYTNMIKDDSHEILDYMVIGTHEENPIKYRTEIYIFTPSKIQKIYEKVKAY